jgi:dihydromonapterin reductase/dihydrofolate reductase
MLKEAVFITGAGQRIGFYLAEKILQATPYPLVFTYRTLRPQVQALMDQGALGIQADFTQPGTVERVMTELSEKVESLRAIIHNASLWISDDQVNDNPALMDAMLAVHVKAPYQLNVQCEPWLRRHFDKTEELADIIHITDCKAVQGASDYAAYLASKAGLHSMTRSFAKKFAPKIKVNEIAPGLILFNEGDGEAYRQKRLSQNLIPIEPGAEVIWQAASYLLNSPYATGSVMELGHIKAEG